jgi:hypothetical protein
MRRLRLWLRAHAGLPLLTGALYLTACSGESESTTNDIRHQLALSGTTVSVEAPNNSHLNVTVGAETSSFDSKGVRSGSRWAQIEGNLFQIRTTVYPSPTSTGTATFAVTVEPADTHFQLAAVGNANKTIEYTYQYSGGSREITSDGGGPVDQGFWNALGKDMEGFLLFQVGRTDIVNYLNATMPAQTAGDDPHFAIAAAVVAGAILIGTGVMIYQATKYEGGVCDCTGVWECANTVEVAQGSPAPVNGNGQACTYRYTKYRYFIFSSWSWSYKDVYCCGWTFSGPKCNPITMFSIGAPTSLPMQCSANTGDSPCVTVCASQPH